MTYFLSASKQYSTPTVMDQFASLHPREAVERVSATLGCSPTSAQVAAYFDKHDKLSELRENFLFPKIAELPPSE